jgi:hypothetical protein
MTPEEKAHIIDNYYKDGLKDTRSKLNNVLNFIVSFFEDDDNIQPIKKELEFIINKLK